VHLGDALAERGNGILQHFGSHKCLQHVPDRVNVPIELEHVRVELVQVLDELLVRLQLLLLQQSIYVLQHANHIL
jgi:hypothetical protein